MIENSSQPPHVIADPIWTIRKFFLRDENLNSNLSAPFLASQLVRNLNITGSLPVHVDCVDGWWIVVSDKDWLIQPDRPVSMQNFHHIVPFPEAGREASRSEILLTAFASAVVTCGATDGMTWITGDPNKWLLPPKILEYFLRPTLGRAVAFKLGDYKAKLWAV